MLSRHLQVIHHTKRVIILDSKLCPHQFPPKMKRKEIWHNPIAIDSHAAKRASGCQACIVTLEDYLQGYESLLRQQGNSSDLAKL